MDQSPPSYLVRGGLFSAYALRVAVLLASVVGVPLVALVGGPAFTAGRPVAGLEVAKRVTPERAGVDSGAASAVDLRIVEMLHRLQRAGALYYRLDREPGSDATEAFVFQCRMQGAAATFTASEGDALAAIGRVLGQVETWLAAEQSPAQASSTTAHEETAVHDLRESPRRR